MMIRRHRVVARPDAEFANPRRHFLGDLASGFGFHHS
jgi:hypothetical protein